MTFTHTTYDICTQVISQEETDQAVTALLGESFEKSFESSDITMAQDQKSTHSDQHPDLKTPELPETAKRRYQQTCPKHLGFLTIG